MLPPSLRDEVMSNTFGEIIENVKFFNEIKDHNLLWKILPLLRPIRMEKSDVLYFKGDLAEDSNVCLLIPTFYSLFHIKRQYKALYR